MAHALDDADAVVVHGPLSRALIIRHPVEHRREHGLEHRVRHVASEVVVLQFVVVNTDQMTAAPLTPIVCPFTYPAASEQRNEHTAATSSATPRRPAGMDWVSTSVAGSLPSFCCSRSIGESMTKGGTVFAVTPLRA